ncbi:MAG: hypothetical protein JXB85_14570 [Anaerolineales bacterium]|nr:hypothetical protein [Anaerolineales bacterium]
MNRPLCVDVVLFRLCDEVLEVLLAARGGALGLPGEPPRSDESLEQTADRLIGALVDRRGTYLEQLYTYGEAERTLRVVYIALAPGVALPMNKQGRWVPAADPTDMAADELEILAYALRRLRYKLEYSAVGFQLLPEEFTLSELQHTYEIILGEQLDKRNFRRRILHSGIIEETSHLRSGEGRPARLFRYRPDAVAEVRARRLFP